MSGNSGSKLLASGPQRTYAGRHLTTISFPLGGIGTGSVGLSGQGGLVDWEIFNRPNVGSRFPRTFPLIWAREQGEAPVCRVLLGPAQPPFQGRGHGDPHDAGEGLPRMTACTFRGEYPFAWVDFACEKLPVKVSLEAYNPFIPGEPDDSGHPAAILRYTLTNRTQRPVRATVAWSLLNMIGSIGNAERDPSFRDVDFGFGQNVNTALDDGGVRGLLFTSEKYPEGHPRHGSMALVTPERSVTVLRRWARLGWFDALQDFWDGFGAKGGFEGCEEDTPSEEGKTDAGALGIRVNLKPGASRTVTFYLTWYFPVFEKYWGKVPCCDSPSCCGAGGRATWRNYYAGQFDDALDVAKKLRGKEKRLRETSLLFHDALFSTTAPPQVLDAVSSQMAILKTATCLRLTDGTFYGFEGCSPVSGCCEGSCTHVWNYQQALPFLFPSLERSMRSADYRYNMRDDGGMCFRLRLPLGSPPDTFHACGDGQMGGVIKTYRDWKISGDDAWLRSVWPSVKRALEYAWVQWDADRDGVMEGIQHNTYDIEFFGPNPLMGGFYLGALAAASEMAEYLGDTAAAAEYREVYGKGRAWIEEHLFNGEFYVQQYDPEKAPRYQFGAGCLADQVLGQWLAKVAGLGDVLDRKQVRRALRSIYKCNWKEDLWGHANAQRVYALQDEAGLVMCTWPHGGRPAFPFPYADEVWTGIEYQVASHLIMEGMVAQGLRIVKGARERHDGLRRNPWNEFECGNHYARAMSSYGLLTAVGGFTFDKGAGRIGFAPRLNQRDFETFWALDGAWGTYSQRVKGAKVHIELKVLHGALKVRQIDLAPELIGAREGVRLARPRVCRPGKPLVMAIALKKGRGRASSSVADASLRECDALR